jgi:hypothetical protein
VNDIAQPSILRRVLALQNVLLEQGAVFGDTDAVCPVKHHFSPGLYAREMFIPAGTVIVGKMHRHQHLAAVLRGRISIAGEDGASEVCGPALFVSQAMTKRAGYALEDTVWVTFHPTEKTDLADIEADVIVPESEVLAMSKQEAIQ